MSNIPSELMETVEIYRDGSKHYFDKHGMLHRDNGPAVEHANGGKEYYWQGIEQNEVEYNKIRKEYEKVLKEEEERTKKSAKASNTLASLKAFGYTVSCQATLSIEGEGFNYEYGQDVTDDNKATVVQEMIEMAFKSL